MIKTFYTPKQVIDQGNQSFGMIKSPSALKPKQISESLKSLEYVKFKEPNPISIDDIKLCHSSRYVDGIFNLSIENGFGNISKDINDTLLYTNGAMYDAAIEALISQYPTCALVSGFHHAGYNGWREFGYFCTFNGLMITAMKLVNQSKKVAIVDCDMHWGNGTDDILSVFNNLSDVKNISFGKVFGPTDKSSAYLQAMQHGLRAELNSFKPDVILYQAGADVHINDPYGGILTTDEIYERDKIMFTISKEMETPIAWNLAGGYQIEPDGSIQKVIDIHLNTFRACKEVYNL